MIVRIEGRMGSGMTLNAIGIAYYTSVMRRVRLVSDTLGRMPTTVHPFTIEDFLEALDEEPQNRS